MRFASLEEIERFVAAFEAGTLSRPEWSHRAHLAIATWYLSKHPASTATPLIRNGILKLNTALGVLNDADNGYHETITLFYIEMIGHHLRNNGNGSSLLASLDSLFATRGHKDLPLEYYSRERLMSREARAQWINPDLKPFEWANLAPTQWQ